MKFIEINGKLIRKDPKYYLQDVLEYPEFDGSYDSLESFLSDVNEEYEIHFINHKCLTKALLDLFLEYDNKSEYVNVFIDD